MVNVKYSKSVPMNFPNFVFEFSKIKLFKMFREDRNYSIRIRTHYAKFSAVKLESVIYKLLLSEKK